MLYISHPNLAQFIHHKVNYNMLDFDLCKDLLYKRNECFDHRFDMLVSNVLNLLKVYVTAHLSAQLY